MVRDCGFCKFSMVHPTYLEFNKLWCRKKQQAINYQWNCLDFEQRGDA